MKCWHVSLFHGEILCLCSLVNMNFFFMTGGDACVFHDEYCKTCPQFNVPVEEQTYKFGFFLESFWNRGVGPERA